MFLTTAFLCTILNVVVTQIYIPSQSIAHNAYETKYAPQYTNYKPKNYAFNYGVSDPKTGDHKSQWEKRENGVTVGMYSLLEPDGSKRVVEYIADSLHGFRALVKKIPIHPHQLPIVYKAGFNTVPVQHLQDNTNVNDERENTHEAIVLKPSEPADEEQESEYEKQQEEEEEEPINKETEEVDTHRKENEESEDGGYTDDDHEDKRSADDDDDGSSYSSYQTYEDEDDD